jgi:type IV pilus assembly protein PilV
MSPLGTKHRRLLDRPRSRRYFRGITLLEALITLLVMSIGLLGIAALQVIGVQETASAMRHSQAIWLAYDMADRMRANPAGIAAGHYDDINTKLLPANPPSCGAGDDCSPQQIATMDTNEWGSALQRLAGGLGTVTVDAGPPERFLVRVRWTEDVPDSPAYRDSKGCPSDPNILDTCVEITVQP